MRTLVNREELVFGPPELGCVLHLPGLPGGSNKIYDRSPYGNHGTITGATWKRLPSGLWYLSFDGADDQVNFGNATSLQITDFTVMGWLNVIELGSWDGFITKMTNAYVGWNLHSSGTEGVVSMGVGAPESDKNSTAALLTIGEWVFLAVVKSGLSVNFYRNGEAWGSDTFANDISDITTSDLEFGRLYTNNAGFRFDGSCALLRIQKRSLSVFEIKNVFHREKHLFGVW